MKNSKKKRMPAGLGMILILAGIVLIISAAVICISVRQKDKAAAQSARSAAEMLHALIPENSGGEPSETPDASTADEKESPASDKSISKDKKGSSGQNASAQKASDTARSKESAGEETIYVDGEYWLGILSFPGYSFELPVLANWNYADLDIAPARYTGTIAANDLVIAGHNYDSHFGFLNTIRYGEEVVFTDAAGSRIHYTVSLVEVLPPTAYTEMTSGDWDLTLFTCTYGGQTRHAVRCTRETKGPDPLVYPEMIE